MDSTVTPCSAIASASSAGLAFSSSRLAAPTRSGNSSSAPSPNVNASGGVPANRSSGTGFSTCPENVSAAASRSRWKCMAAFGLPVVPDVNAIMATSSAAVCTEANSAGFPAASWVRSPGPAPPNSTIRRSGIAAARRSAVSR